MQCSLDFFYLCFPRFRVARGIMLQLLLMNTGNPLKGASLVKMPL